MADLDTSAEDGRRASQVVEVYFQYFRYRDALTARLAARYPGVNILSVNVTTLDDSEIQQTVKFRATREVLLASGLATEHMFAVAKRWDSTTALGCGFILHESFDGEFAVGSWDLLIFTGETPRGRPLNQKGLREVAKLLRKFQPKARRAA